MGELPTITVGLRRRWRPLQPDVQDISPSRKVSPRDTAGALCAAAHAVRERVVRAERGSSAAPTAGARAEASNPAPARA